MKSCTFFGHRDTPSEIAPLLKSAIIDLVENEGVTMFYVGCEGSFDRMAHRLLYELKQTYPHINYARVLAYIPKKSYEDLSDTIYPECVAISHPRYAIAKRNQYMIDKADFVIAYVKLSFGGAYRYYNLAKKKG
ncbi:MAG: hypothetical protein IJC83_04740, partial [Oscillospiraceae bacterium]|nr:hypothetical protein [Oscillospiraceae bacterium]